MPTFRELLTPWQDTAGVMMGKGGGLDGNAILSTGAKFVLLDDQGLIGPEDVETYKLMLADAERKPGLLDRYGKHPDQQQDDDYIGAAASSSILDDGKLAKRIVAHGRENFYCWDNTSDKWNIACFFVRKPSWWAMMKTAAKEWQNPFDQLMVFLNFSVIVFYQNGSSGVLKDYQQYKVFMKKCSWWTHPLTRLGCVIFKTAYLWRHPRGIKESYTDYYGPLYPFSQLPDGNF